MTFMQDFNSLFAPMDKKYCGIFYGISFIYFFLMISSIVSLVFLLKDFKRYKFLIFQSIIVMIGFGVNYFYNRLLFNMCK